MANLPSVKAYVQTEATRFRSAVSESVIQILGSAVNWLIDKADSLQSQVTALQNAVVSKSFWYNSSSGTTTEHHFFGNVSAVDVVNFQTVCVAGDTVRMHVAGAKWGGSAYTNAFSASTPYAPGWAVRYRLYRNSTIIKEWAPTINAGGAFSQSIADFMAYDIPGAGTHTYRFELAVINGIGQNVSERIYGGGMVNFEKLKG